MSLYVPLPSISTRTKKIHCSLCFGNIILAFRHSYKFFEATSKPSEISPSFSIQYKTADKNDIHGNPRLDPWPCWQWDHWIHGYGHLDIHHCKRTGQDQGWGDGSKKIQDIARCVFFDDSIKDHSKNRVHFFDWLYSIIERLF